MIHSRWKIYLDYLEAHGDDYSQVFVTDVRDVFFQGDIFAAFGGRQNWLGYAAEADNIRGDKTKDSTNYAWIADCFGKDEAEKLADKKIVCAGTVIGSVAEMKIFCREMWRALANKTVWGHDQAMMNYFVWHNLLPIENLIELDVDGGEILTVGLLKNLYPIEIRDDKILRGNGGVPAVVHQYDRIPNAVQLVDRIYRDKNFRTEEKFTDPRSVTEQIIYLLHTGRLVEAAMFSVKNFSDEMNFSGNVDVLLKLWNFLLQKPLTPLAGYLELSIQNALRNVNALELAQLEKIFAALSYSLENFRAVNVAFKNMTVDLMLKLAEQNFQAGNAEACFYLLEAINSLKVPPTRDFYLFAAKVNRTFGRKDAALAAYEKALELG